MSSGKKGTLMVCATPIGNLDDITMRVLDALRSAGAVICEDTRRSLKLLNHFGIKPPVLLSYHRHSPEKRKQEVLKILGEGRLVALVADGGTPVLSDPGADLVKAAREKGFNVTILPGASAVTGAIAVSGLPGDSFIFAGFLDRNRKKRIEELELLAGQQKTIVIFEAPHRLKEMLTDMTNVMPDSEVVIARELTKIYEEVLVGSPADMLAHFRDNEPRGEFTLVVKAGHVQEEEEKTEKDLRKDLNRLIDANIPPASAVKAVSLLRGVPKKKVYALMLKETKEE